MRQTEAGPVPEWTNEDGIGPATVAGEGVTTENPACWGPDDIWEQAFEDHTYGAYLASERWPHDGEAQQIYRKAWEYRREELKEEAEHEERRDARRAGRKEESGKA